MIPENNRGWSQRISEQYPRGKSEGKLLEDAREVILRSFPGKDSRGYREMVPGGSTCWISGLLIGGTQRFPEKDHRDCHKFLEENLRGSLRRIPDEYPSEYYIRDAGDSRGS